jgi:sigma-B regulation protein RsbU (phosphoserine phosphatase)
VHRTEAAADEPGAAQFTILVVDDSALNLRLLVQTLQGRGYRILAARSGQAALDIARRTHPDMVLLDVMMPEMDGFDVCRALKGSRETADAIVIFLSALGEVSDRVAGLELGASDYITKPIQADEVLARVANHLARRQLEQEVRRGRDELERELASAARMQRLLLPARLPSCPEVTFDSFYQTSRYAGGDYYDVIRLEEGRFGVLIADVSGHGASAAIVMAMIRAVLHASPRATFAPADVLLRINRHFEYLWDTPMFATALCAVLDASSRELSIACAGHPPPLLYRDGSASPLECVGAMPVLLMDLAEMPVTAHRLSPGDRVLFYTDGVTERFGPGESMYELDRLVSMLSATGALPPAAVIPRIVADVENFARECEAEDDQTLLLLALGSAWGSREPTE